MAFLMDIPKTDTIFYHEFKEAYWSIDSVLFTTQEGVAYTQLILVAYPSREAKYMDRVPLEEQAFHWGGPPAIAYSPKLHYWEATFETLDIFPEGIPVSEAEQKNVLYLYVKAFLGITDFTDVFEEGQKNPLNNIE